MQIPKKYFQDRFVLLLLSINSFLTLFGAAFILLRLDSGRGDSYIVQFRGNQGLDAYDSGGAIELLAFIAFSLFVLIFHTVLALLADDEYSRSARLVCGGRADWLW